MFNNFKSLPDRPTPSDIQALQSLLLLDMKYHGQYIDREALMSYYTAIPSDTHPANELP